MSGLTNKVPSSTLLGYSAIPDMKLSIALDIQIDIDKPQDIQKLQATLATLRGILTDISIYSSSGDRG